eukprot:jgi/Mesvir1/17938/Mv12991-RA.1
MVDYSKQEAKAGEAGHRGHRGTTPEISAPRRTELEEPIHSPPGLTKARKKAVSGNPPVVSVRVDDHGTSHSSPADTPHLNLYTSTNPGLEWLRLLALGIAVGLYCFALSIGGRWLTIALGESMDVAHSDPRPPPPVRDHPAPPARLMRRQLNGTSPVCMGWPRHYLALAPNCSESWATWAADDLPLVDVTSMPDSPRLMSRRSLTKMVHAITGVHRHDPQPPRKPFETHCRHMVSEVSLRRGEDKLRDCLLRRPFSCNMDAARPHIASLHSDNLLDASVHCLALAENKCGHMRLSVNVESIKPPGVRTPNAKNDLQRGDMSCAVVFDGSLAHQLAAAGVSSGSMAAAMIGSGEAGLSSVRGLRELGQAIDVHDVVIRTSNGEGGDGKGRFVLGRVTHMRLLNKRQAKLLADKYGQPGSPKLSPDRAAEQWVFWDYGSLGYMEQLARQHPQLYALSPTLLAWQAKVYFAVRQDMQRLGLGPFDCPTALSTEVHAILLAAQMCTEVNVFGFPAGATLLDVIGSTADDAEASITASADTDPVDASGSTSPRGVGAQDASAAAYATSSSSDGGPTCPVRVVEAAGAGGVKTAAVDRGAKEFKGVSRADTLLVRLMALSDRINLCTL